MAAREGGQQCSRIPKRGQIGEIILSQYKLNVNCCDDVAGHKTKFFDSPLKDLDILRMLSIKYIHYQVYLIFNLNLFLTFYIIRNISSQSLRNNPP